MPTNEEKLSSVQPTQDEVASDNQEKTEVEAPVNTLKAIGLKKDTAVVGLCKTCRSKLKAEKSSVC